MAQLPSFTGFTKYDPNNKLFVTENIVDVIAGAGGNTRMVYQLLTTITDFSYNFLYNKTSFAGNTGTFVIYIANQDSQWEIATCSGVGVYHDGGSLYASQALNGVAGLAGSPGVIINAGTNYYCTISRTGNVLALSVFTDINRTTHAPGSPVSYTPCLTTSFGFLHLYNMLSTHIGLRTNSLSRNDSLTSTLWSTPANKGIPSANSGRYFGNGLVIIQTAIAPNNGKIIRSTDYGLTWGSIISTGLNTANIMPDSDAGVILVGSGSDGKIARSTDNGLTWAAIATGKIENGLASMGNGKYLSAGGDPNVVISSDYGLTWGAPINTGAVQNSMPVSMGNGIVIIGEVTNGNIQRSADYGSTWATIATPASKNFYLLKADNVCIFADWSGNITRSLDNGLTWSALIPTKLTSSPIALIYAGNGIIYASDTASRYVSKSTDYGLTWALERTDQTDTTVIILAESTLMSIAYATGLISYQTIASTAAPTLGIGRTNKTISRKGASIPSNISLGMR